MRLHRSLRLPTPVSSQSGHMEGQTIQRERNISCTILAPQTIVRGPTSVTNVHSGETARYPSSSITEERNFLAPGYQGTQISFLEVVRSSLRQKDFPEAVAFMSADARRRSTVAT